MREVMFTRFIQSRSVDRYVAPACCYNFPDTAKTKQGEASTATWPQVALEQWCGRYSVDGLPPGSTGPAGAPGPTGSQGVPGTGTPVVHDTALLDFGTIPTDFAFTVVTGQSGILPTSHVRVSMQGDVLTYNDENTHLLAAESIKLTAGIPVLNSGFTIYAQSLFGYWTMPLRVRWSWWN